MRLLVRSFRVETVETRLKRPFITALGRKDATVNAALTLRLSDGSEGYGEASTSLAWAELSAPRLVAALRGLAAAVVGRDARAWATLCARAWTLAGPAKPAAAAFESALLSALAAAQGCALAQWLGGACWKAETDVTISATGATEAAQAARDAACEGFRLLKVKVGTGLRADLARLDAARRAHPRARWLLDGNQGLTEASAAKLLEACAKLGVRVELLEQPLPKDDLKGMARLVRRCQIPIAADESLRSAEDALRLIDLGAASALNVKLAKTGLTRSLQILAAARAARLPLMIGCMAETARGLSASVHFALGTGAFRWLDLDSDHLLVEAGGRQGWTRRGPTILLT